jgi:apolipoprotein D and lipocalin family protein
MPPPETVESVDLESYAGLWYEYARYDTPFDEDAEEVTAEYTLNDDGTVKVVNRGVSPDGNPTFIEGVARVLDPETNAKLGVTFDREDLAGIEFDYWIIELDEDYEWAVVTNATRFVLYILSRTPALDETVYEDLLYRITKKGFEADKVQLTSQP